jgi:hypothetical protein
MSLEKKEKEDEKRWLILKTKVYEEKIKSAFVLFRAHHIEPILIKGWAAAAEYPEKYLRTFSDIDLCVPPEDYEKSQKLVAAGEGQMLNVDLHCGLRHLDTLEWDDLFENCVLELLGDIKIRILRPEDHLRVLCVHWLNDGGANKERLLDIYYLLKNHSDNFDWNRCFGKISKTRREWIIKTIAVVHKYHELDISKLPFAVESELIPGWFTKTLEKEWASETKLISLHILLGNRREFWKQVKKRIPPNAIQSTIEMEGAFDEAPRIYYQIGSIVYRLKPSIVRVYSSLKNYLQKGSK